MTPLNLKPPLIIIIDKTVLTWRNGYIGSWIPCIHNLFIFDPTAAVKLSLRLNIPLEGARCLEALTGIAEWSCNKRSTFNCSDNTKEQTGRSTKASRCHAWRRDWFNKLFKVNSHWLIEIPLLYLHAPFPYVRCNSFISILSVTSCQYPQFRAKRIFFIRADFIFLALLLLYSAL